MVTFLKGRRRDDESLVAVNEQGANITANLEALVRRAEAAAEQLRQLAPVMEPPGKAARRIAHTPICTTWRTARTGCHGT